MRKTCGICGVIVEGRGKTRAIIDLTKPNCEKNGVAVTGAKIEMCRLSGHPSFAHQT